MVVVNTLDIKGKVKIPKGTKLVGMKDLLDLVY